MYTSILVCRLSNLLLNEHDDDDDIKEISDSQENNVPIYSINDY